MWPLEHNSEDKEGDEKKKCIDNTNKKNKMKTVDEIFGRHRYCICLVKKYVAVRKKTQ